jgi:ribosome-associated translation inhibitor RaiA/cold shock CspA family protein
MQKPLQVTFRNVEPSPALESAVRERAEKLEKFCDQIIGCRVIVESPHKHHHQGNLYNLRIYLTVPDKEIVVQRSPDEDHSREDPYVAVRDAFDSVRRQLEDYVRQRRGKIKLHEPTAHGRISVLEPNLDYGRLETPDGREVYFHRNCLVNAEFDELTIGAELRFVEEAGEMGPQASSAFVIGKHHPVP